MIHDLRVTPLQRIPDERGAVLHMLREDDPAFERFGEIYFSLVYPGVVKGWHLHKRMTLNYAVPIGMVDVSPSRLCARGSRAPSSARRWRRASRPTPLPPTRLLQQEGQ